MSKNIFNVLAKEDSDEEKKAKPAEKHMSKKESRALDSQRREAFPTSGLKEDHVHDKNPKKVKDDYAPGEKRPFERHSGTGRQAFGKDFKKGGFGKGNVGKEGEEEAAVGGEAAEGGEAKEKAEEKPKEEIVTLDVFMKEKGRTVPGKAEEPAKVKAVQDPSLIPMKTKDKEKVEAAPAQKKKKNPDALIQPQENALIPPPSENLQRKDSKPDKKVGKKQANEEDFPPLSK